MSYYETLKQPNQTKQNQKLNITNNKQKRKKNK